MNLTDRIVAVFDPARALRRAHAREVLASYEAARPSKRYKKSRDASTGERLVVRDAAACRAIARDLERNHDLVRGAFATLTRNVIGPTGISIEPTPRKGARDSGVTVSASYDDIDDDFARQLLNLWREWSRAPEVTRTMDWIQAQELACRSWLRDGDVFAQLVEGTAGFIRHGSAVPLSIELLEADVVPLQYSDEAKNIDAGIQRNEWGQPTGYYAFKRHPGNGGWMDEANLKRIPADRMLHVAVRERLSGLRGISIIASAIDRLMDLKDYEESERVAARIGAAIAAFVSRDVNMEWTPPPPPADGEQRREIQLEAGSICQDLAPGEKLELLDAKRPNTGLDQFRRSQLRAAARSCSLTYSAFAGDYDGTYSAQRQELVEGYDGYRVLTAQFVARFVQPIWERFVTMAIASGQLKVPAGVRPETVAQAEFRGPKMPWIDPQREASALLTLARGGWQSLQQGIAERGGRLQDVFEQLGRERALADEIGLVLDSDARYTSKAGVTNARPGESNFPDPEGDEPDAGVRTRSRLSRGIRNALNGNGGNH